MGEENEHGTSESLLLQFHLVRLKVVMSGYLQSLQLLPESIYGSRLIKETLEMSLMEVYLT